ncbi:MAG TPA: response regulator [Trueperaceae bacterium]
MIVTDRDPASPAIFHVPPKEFPMHAPERATVFIVEDSVAHQTVLNHLLQNGGYATEAFDSGEEVLARLAHERPDVLLTDVNLPGVSGRDVLAWVRAEPRLASLKVVLVSVSPANLVTAGTDQPVPDAVLCKPIDKQDLLDTLARLAAPHHPDARLAELLLLEP